VLPDKLEQKRGNEFVKTNIILTQL